MYAYCGNNPANGVDYSGHGWIVDWILSIIKQATCEAKGPVSGYDRTAAVSYARAHSKNPNPDYPNYEHKGGDCTNFVSQCLEAGGYEQNSEWACGKSIIFKSWLSVFGNKNYQWSPTDSWINASKNYEYVTTTFSCTVITITDNRQLSTLADAASPGDLLYFGNNGEIKHAAMITDENYGYIYYSQRSSSKVDVPLCSFKKYDRIYVVVLGD